MKIYIVSIVLSLNYFLSAIFLFTNTAFADDFNSDISGSWYPSDKDKLSAEIAKMLEVKAPDIEGDIRALLLPHAGYQYSGITAVKALKAINKKYGTILIIGPTHRYAMKDTISVPVFESYVTPLGKATIDREKAEQLLKSSGIFKNMPEALSGEHSVQIEVPLVQYALKDAKIIFLITGQMSKDKMKEAGEKIAGIWDEDTLIITSSDFTHYGSRFGFTPFSGDIAGKVSKLDMKAFSFVEKNDPSGFYDFVKSSGATICGATPITILLYAAGTRLETKLVEYTDSSKKTSDADRVSYVSAVMIKKDGIVHKEENESGEFGKEDRKLLLSAARKTIEYALKNRKIPDAEDIGVVPTEKIKNARAAFVTLTIGGRLRGCIGEILPSQALYKSVIENAANAAFNDNRFPPLTKNEFQKIHIEISVLTVPKDVKSADEIVLGRDGIILSKGGRRALFLPQVAPEQGWTLKETLEHLSMKAGLEKNAWKQDCSFKTFHAEVFGE